MKFTPVIADFRAILGEGPCYDQASGTLYWVDINGGRGHALVLASGAFTTFTFDEPVSALVPRAGGGLLVALQSGIKTFDPMSGKLTPFATLEDPALGNRPNEARVDPAGRLWVGTMQNNVGADGGDTGVHRKSGVLYRVDADGTVSRHADGIGISNTLCWDPARRRLYFADTTLGTIWVHDFDPTTGTLAKRRVFAATEGHGHPDGSAIDADGYLWNARWGGSCIIRYTPDGAIDRIVEVPVKQPTSCVFGGPQLQTLYVTSAAIGLPAGGLDGALLAATAPIAGQPCTRFAG